jgi:hypothetical protein
MESVQVSPVCDVRNCQSRPVHRHRRLHAGRKLVTFGLLALALPWGASSHAALHVQGTNVQGTNVQGTNVQGTNVQGTNVQGTNVQGTNVQGTNVQGTNVQGTNVQGTNVQGTNVQGTNVQGTNVQGTNVQGTNVQGQSHYGNAMLDSETRTIRLAGFKIDPETAAPTFIAIRSFQGDAIDALVWTPKLGHRESILSPSELIGLEWIEPHCTTDGQCSSLKHRIVGGAPDISRSTMPLHRDNRDIWLFEVQYASLAAPSERGWQNLCQPDHHGETRGLFLEGQWRADGSWEPRGHTFACTSGVLAKCARNWGYKPWKQVTTASGPVSLQPLHQACTRAARADYCGDGISHTRNGTLIDLFDRYGLNVREQVAGFDAEAGFTTDGAAWMSRPRWPRGDEDRGTYVQLPTCARPKRIAPASEEDVLVQVWSRAPAPPARD